uniref:F-actin-capping protein subunit alpha n=1 Tax=Globisporangium ultimum (strain ATCC 200006 / CBS 805.95 / DAOM BR144) TaxID=431595 RepID=K3WD37_GLOUD
MADEWGYEDAPDDEKLRIAQHFLLSSPPGQIHDVLRDVAKLVPARVLTDSALRGALRAYNVANTLPIDVPDADYRMLICEEGEVDATHYVDPIGKRVFGVDHVKQQVIPEDVAELPASFTTSFESERLLVEKALQSYLQFEYMHQGTAGVYVKDTHLVVNFCAQRINLRNFWSGRWKSRWEVDLSVHPLVVKGGIALHVHYFENGNLQLQNEKVIDDQELRVESTTALGDALLRVIKDAEDDLQTNLEDMYINMSQETFKEMRRVMPITQTKMEWNLHAHRTARGLGNK